MPFPLTLNRLFIQLLILVSLSISTLIQAHAEINSNGNNISDGAAINIAGRQRMLSERMVKAYIQLSIDVDVQKAQVQLEIARQLFDNQLILLNRYAPTEKITNNLSNVQEQWLKVASIVQATPEAKNIPELIILGEELVARSHQVVLDIQHYSGEASAALVNTSGRQRMLSQRMAKYYFAHLAGQRQNKTTTQFKNSLAEFEQGLIDLTQASENNMEINQALKKVGAQLHFSKSGFKQLESGNYAPHVISRTTESMLKRMEIITEQYQILHDKQKTS